MRHSRFSAPCGRPAPAIATRCALLAGLAALWLSLTCGVAFASTQTTTITAEGETAYSVPAGTVSLQVTVVGAAGGVVKGNVGAAHLAWRRRSKQPSRHRQA